MALWLCVARVSEAHPGDDGSDLAEEPRVRFAYPVYKDGGFPIATRGGAFFTRRGSGGTWRGALRLPGLRATDADAYFPSFFRT